MGATAEAMIVAAGVMYILRSTVEIFVKMESWAYKIRKEGRASKPEASTSDSV